MPFATVRPEWVDHYGHMNMAYYLVVFDQATDALWPYLGLGNALHAAGLGTFCAESWVNYRREVRLGDPLDVTSELLTCDDKRLIALHRLRHAEQGHAVAENEVLYLCVNLATRRVVPWPDAVAARLGSAATAAPPSRLTLRRRDTG